MVKPDPRNRRATLAAVAATDASLKRAGKLRRDVLERAARRAGLDSDLALFTAPRTDTERAYALLGCGVDILVDFTDPDTFPSPERRVARRGARQVRKRFKSDDAVTAASFLAQAMGLLRANLDPALGETETAASELVQEVFPISDDDLATLDRLAGEFRVLETGQLRPDFALGAETGSGYHLALLDGQDPSHDEELVEAQRRYATGFLITEAERHALSVLLDESWGDLEAALPVPASLATTSWC
jgi:hypothetical protein